MTGWIKIHRDLMDHWVSDEPESLAVFLRLLCEANFVSKKRQINGSPVVVPRGSLVFGYNAFSERSGVSTAKLRRIMKKLKDEGIIDRQNFSKFSIVSITKYEDYQSDDKQPASSQQAASKQPATLEEGKNSRREEKDVCGSSRQGREPDASDIRMAELMAERVGERTETDKSGKVRGWANTMRLIRERDGRTEEQIRYLINWTHRHEFWQMNILSPDKLRKQWDRLAMEAKQENQKSSGRPDNRHTNLAPATANGLKETEGGGFKL